jgi:lipopolysaccharide transport system ATP-binding protein
MSYSDLALSVRELSKSYTIAHQATQKESTLAETVLQRLKRPFARSTKETFWALKDVSFDVKKGEVVGIIGRNGAGKSTLLKVLSRITEPTEGQIDLFGRVGSLLEVGTGFHPELTGRENVFLNGAILGMTRAEIRRQFDAIIDFAGVEKFLDTPVKRYSSGMYVRLAFAVAAHLRSEILIVDEVLAVGDAEFQKKCLGKMQDVAHDGRTVLFVSHNMAAVRGLCRSALWLVAGAVHHAGASTETVDAYTRDCEENMLAQMWTQEDAPASEGIRLVRAAIHGLPRDSRSIDRGRSWSVRFTIDNMAMSQMLNLSLHVFTEDGLCAFNTYSRSQCLPPGVHEFECRVPSFLLNACGYSIELLIVQNSGTVLLRMKDVLRFTISDVGRNDEWLGSHPGAVRPALDWVVNGSYQQADRLGYADIASEPEID